MEIQINSTGQVLTGKNSKEITDQLIIAGIIPAPQSDKYNPMMLLQGPLKNGIIKVIGNGNGAINFPVPNNIQAMQHGAMPDHVNLAELLANALNPFIKQDQPAQMDEARIMELIKEEVANVRPQRIEVLNNNIINVVDGPLHPKFTDLLQICGFRDSVLLVGPAGSGKTTSAYQVAKALNLTFYCLSVCSQTTATSLLGYNGATGEYVESLFYKAYKEGGIFLLDEIDNGNPNVISVLNAALSNGHCAFPCGMVERHKDFVLIAAANTIGTGGNIQYVGRNPIDGATIDRFIFMHWGYDENFENEITTNPELTAKVQELRAKVISKGLRVIISPRASIIGAKYLKKGWSMEKVLNMLIFDKMTESDRKTLQS